MLKRKRVIRKFCKKKSFCMFTVKNFKESVTNSGLLKNVNPKSVTFGDYEFGIFLFFLEKHKLYRVTF